MLKKIILCLSLIIPSTVFATKYYTPYYEFENKEELLENDLIMSKDVTLYNTYKIEKKYTGYDASDRCSNYDEEDYIEGTFARNYSSSTMKDTLITPLIAKGYVTRLQIISDEDTIVRDVKLYYNGNLIDYQARYMGDEDKLSDNDSNTTEMLYGQMSYFMDLYEPIDPLKVEVVIDSDEPIIGAVTYTYLSQNSEPSVLYRINSNKIIWLKTLDYNNLFKSLGYTSPLRFYGYHQLEGKMYNCYEEEKIATGEYKDTSEFIIEDDFKIVKKYYKRDYIDIDDLNIIYPYIKLDELILSSSVDKDKIEIDSSINTDSTINVDFKIGDYIISRNFKYVLPTLNTYEPVEEKEEKEEIINKTVIPEKENQVLESIKANDTLINEKIEEVKKEKTTPIYLRKKEKLDNEEELDFIPKVEPLKKIVNEKEVFDYRVVLFITLLFLLICLYMLYRKIKT